MSDREIFIIGVLASALMAIHLIVNIVQFWKMGRESDRAAEELKEER